jgi:alpha-D-ribose 1-methylphosphonate 5-triphosphate diphosphatase
LLANGITTAFHGVTLSCEPGQRSDAAFRSMIAAWRALAPCLGADHRIHLQLETFAMDQWPAAEASINAGAVHLLAFNGHTAEIARRAADPARASRYADRAKVTGAEMLALAQAILVRSDAVEPFVSKAAALGRDAGLVMASHDDASPETRARWRALGCTICEFPMNEETALAARGACTLVEAWAIVSANPAAAAGLADRGRIEQGLRADLVLLDDAAPAGPEVVASLVGGRIAWLSGSGAARLV